MTTIEHVVVLALENRSFDHMLGLLDHPDPSFRGLHNGGPYTNPAYQADATPEELAHPGPDQPTVTAGGGAKRVVPVGPDHSHDAVMMQLALDEAGNPTNNGFVQSYERKGRGMNAAMFDGDLAPILDRMTGRQAERTAVTGRGDLVMLCQTPDTVPALVELALNFAVCDNWFCSVPGETWPNRNFMHAATSDGKTDIEIQPYGNKTIFELLEEHWPPEKDKNTCWHVYHDDTPQIWAFPALWDTPERHAQWFPYGDFAEHVAAGELPAYSFIEPNHRPPLHTWDHNRLTGAPDVSDNQHPENNLVPNDSYDSYTEGPDCDFSRSDELIATVYQALRDRPEVFDRTLLLITYDEHGGLFDHVPPPHACAPEANPRYAHRTFGQELINDFDQFLRHVWSRQSAPFDFTLLGPRVPAVLISPYIKAGTVDHSCYDHASIPATVRALFVPGEDTWLTGRDRHANTFHTVVNLEAARTDLPDLRGRISAHAEPASDLQTALQEDDLLVPQYFHAFMDQAEMVHAHLSDVGEEETKPDLPEHPYARAVEISARFAAAAARHRHGGT